MVLSMIQVLKIPVGHSPGCFGFRTKFLYVLLFRLGLVSLYYLSSLDDLSYYSISLIFLGNFSLITCNVYCIWRRRKIGVFGRS